MQSKKMQEIKEYYYSSNRQHAHHVASQATLSHNKRIQSDASKAGAADARRYKALAGNQVKGQLDVIANPKERRYEALANYSQ